METGSRTNEAARIAELEAALKAERSALEAERARTTRLQKENDRLREAYQRVSQELELLRRRIFVAKAERIDTHQLELEFANKLADLKALEERLPEELRQAIPDAALEDEAAEPSTPDGRGKRKPKTQPKGRRNLADLDLPERRIELTDPAYEELVKERKAVRVGYQLSYRVGYERGGQRKVVIARATYRVEESDGTSAFTTVSLPPEAIPGAMAAPSMLAHAVHQKFGMGLPFFRLEKQWARGGFGIDRGTLCRWAEEIGLSLGASVVEAMRREALTTAFCIATDATGVAVQPPPHETKRRQPCRKGHFFVQIADRDHVFFEYTPRETSAAVAKMFEGFTGYVQADAKSVFDVLFRPPPQPEGDGAETRARQEVGCLAHCRRRFYEATIALKSPVAREGLYRIKRIYELDATWKSCTPEERKRQRDLHLRPQLEAFFTWAQAHFETEKERRGLLRAAFGYAVRQKDALMRFLDDGRLRIDNNESERNIKLVALGRKAWLFVGSDDHGTATANLLSLVASARLHDLDPELYLRDLIRVYPHWPRHRYIELAPKYWATTRARLNADQLAHEYGPLDVPAPLAPAEQQPLPG